MELQTIDIKNNVYWSENDGIRFLMLDFKGLDDYHILQAILFASNLFKNEKLKSIRCVVDITDLDTSFNTHFTLRKLSKDMMKYLHKSSLIGVEGMLVPLYKVYASFTGSIAVLHNSVEDGIAYVCS